MFHKSSVPAKNMCSVCFTGHLLALVFVSVLTIMAAIGVWMSHFPSVGPTFGLTHNSLSIVAFLLCIAFLVKLSVICSCRHETGKKK